MAEDIVNLPVQQQRTLLCTSFPDFAAVCLFIEQFGKLLGLHPLDINRLKEGFEDSSEEVSDLIQGLHLYLLRRIKKNVPSDKWERELIKFCDSYSQWDAWELKERGYGKLKVQTRLCIIRNLLEAQFENNLKFNERLRADIPEEDLRQQCYGRDKSGLCYWLIQDEKLTVNIYQEEQDDTDGTSWRIVAKDRDEMEVLIGCLKENKPIPCVLAQNSDRCDTPLSVLSSATGTAAFNLSRAATPTRFALDRSTPVKLQLSDVVTAKTEPSEEVVESDHKLVIAENSDVKMEAKGDEAKVLTEEKLSVEIKDEPVTEEGGTAEAASSSPKCTSKPETIDCGASASKQGSDHEDLLNDTRIPPTYSATDLSLMSVASDQTPTMKEASDQTSSTDSEENLPLSQLKRSLVLMHKTRCSLMKAKKKHEKKKWKEMMKKKQRRRKKGQKQEVATDSPKSCQRSSGRQRKPVFHDLQIEDDSSDSSLSPHDYPVKKGRNAIRQAKRSGIVQLTTHEELSSEVDNDDTPCTSCTKYNQPHLMLLCDKCDAGWHTGCVKPPLFYIPDGEWHCPNCEHRLLIERLEADLERLDGLIKEKEARMKKLERQEKYALSNGINPSNIITFNSTDRPARERKSKKLDEYAYDSNDDYEEVTMKRSCRTRTKVNYTFEQYEAVMNSAISKGDASDDPTILAGTNSSLVSVSKKMKSSGRHKPPPGQSRGKDISNLLDGTNLSIMSDEEADGDLNTSKEEVTQHGKENANISSQGPVGARKRKRPQKFNDMEPDSAAEDDEDYKMSDEANDDEGPSEGSDENVSDDVWTPGGIRKGGMKGQGRRYGAREKVRDFICDEEESEPERRKKKTCRRPQRSATATQAALRRKREARFGFTSSEESVATTPCSSSTEEEEHLAKRRVNKWNKMKTYSAGAKKTKKEPKKKKKRLKKGFASDESTEESSDSEEEYVPLGEQDVASAAEQEEVSAAEAETDAEDSDGVHRVNNRLESSSEEDMEDSETDNRERRNVSQTRSKVKITPTVKCDRTTPILQNDPTPIMQNDPTPIMQNDPTPIMQNDPTPIMQNDPTPLPQNDSTGVRNGETSLVKPASRTIVTKEKHSALQDRQHCLYNNERANESQVISAEGNKTGKQLPSSINSASINGDATVSGRKQHTDLHTDSHPPSKAHESEAIHKINVGLADATRLNDALLTEVGAPHSTTSSNIQTNNTSFVAAKDSKPIATDNESVAADNKRVTEESGSATIDSNLAVADGSPAVADRDHAAADSDPVAADSKPVVAADSKPVVAAEKMQSSSVPSKQATFTTEAVTTHSDLVSETEADALKSHLPVDSRPSKVPQTSKSTGSRSESKDSLSEMGNVNNGSNHGLAGEGSPTTHFPASGSVRPSYEPGLNPHASFNPFPHAVPGHVMSSEGKRLPGGMHQFAPINSSLQGMNGQPFLQRMPFPPHQFAPENYPQHYPPLYQLPYRHPSVAGHGHCVTSGLNPPHTSNPPHVSNPPQTSNPQTSNAFMVDNLLDSGHGAARYDASASGLAEDDDEMSSYMTMANSITSGGRDK